MRTRRTCSEFWELSLLGKSHVGSRRNMVLLLAGLTVLRLTVLFVELHGK